MKYVYQHYPLALYLRGSYMAVASEEEEAAARAAGWTDYHTDRAMQYGVVAVSPQEVAEIEAAPAKRGPGRPKKQR